MSKSEVSKTFARFANKTTSGAYDEARKAERTARGITLDVGTRGVGVVTLKCTDEEVHDEQVPVLECPITILTPEGAKGKVLTDPLNLKKRIRETEKRSAEENFTAALEMLEQMGCPESITKGYTSWDQITEWFDAEPRKVSYEITDGGSWNGRPQKRVVAYAYVEESSMPSADSGDSPEFPAGTKFCSYKGVRYGILMEDDGMLTIQNVNSGRKKTVDADDVEMEG